MRKRSILLINPKVASRRGLRLPLSLLSLGSALEGRYDYDIVDGNVDSDAVHTALSLIRERPVELVGVSVMPGPQVGPAIEMSRAIRAAYPYIPIAWGGYFPTLYPMAAMNASYVDFVVRGQGEQTLLELLERLPDGQTDRSVLSEVKGLSWKGAGEVVHNPDRHFRPPDDYPPLPYARLRNVRQYLRPSFMGAHTGVHQAAAGCRYHCSFCGVVSMFNGVTKLSTEAWTVQAMTTLRDRYGADSMQFYDNNFFDREATSVPLLEAMSRVAMPWWCFARADTLANFKSSTWELIRESRLRMAYIGAEAASDSMLRSMRKGTKVNHTLEVAARCRENGVIPEFSFVLGGPDEPEAEIETTFRFIKRLKRENPDSEIILYYYSPTPQRKSSVPDSGLGTPGTAFPTLETYGPGGPPMPMTPDAWAEPRWVDYVCHRDAPWLTDRVRRRVEDFSRTLSCRFPTVQDYKTPRWGKSVLKGLASWRYASSRYSRPWELDLARRLIPLRDPRRESL